MVATFDSYVSIIVFSTLLNPMGGSALEVPSHSRDALRSHATTVAEVVKLGHGTVFKLALNS